MPISPVYFCCCIKADSITFCLQLLYDKNGAGVHLRKYMGWSLAWWHNYKWATYRIMSVFAVDFIAPLFHTLFPDRNFSVKMMSVPSCTAILSYIRLSYPKVKPELDAAILQGNTVHPKQMILLLNLRDLFEYFIPTVSLCTCMCVFLFISLFLPVLSLVFKMPKRFIQILCLFVCVVCLCLLVSCFYTLVFASVLFASGSRLLFSLEIQPRS